MKTWVVIFSIYVTLLAVVPCCVFDNCPDDKTATAQSADAGHEQGDEDGCGTCSPFFNCSTCNVSFVTNTLFVYDFVPDGTTSAFQSHYASAVIKNTSGKIWQPPKTA
ncbi:MAG: DUF6660 family protein [Bacteroidota bacterium]